MLWYQELTLGNKSSLITEETSLGIPKERYTLIANNIFPNKTQTLIMTRRPKIEF
jgi:hypothetical protein